jgi:hypothetical protein
MVVPSDENDAVEEFPFGAADGLLYSPFGQVDEERLSGRERVGMLVCMNVLGMVLRGMVW